VSTERHEVIVIGAGQAGLATGYYLSSRGVPFIILEAQNRVGESWRRRWDSLRVFTAAKYDSLPGKRFPAPAHSFPTKDQVADFLEAYASQMRLPVRTGVRVDSLVRTDSGYAAIAGADRYEAGQVVVATGAYHEPMIPDFAAELRPDILQLHSSEYRNPAQLQPGPVLVVGAANSGGEIALDVARSHETWLSGRDVGSLPFEPESRISRIVDVGIWFAFNHVLTMGTPIGRKVRPSLQRHGTPLERARPKHLKAAGVHRVVARTVGVEGGLPALDGGQVLDVRNVVWAIGFRHSYPWIHLPVTDGERWPLHARGVSTAAPGLYFVGLPFQYAVTSPLIGGVGRDARYVVDRLVARRQVAATTN
jgi:putative flavoprotein involved in K+ transport